MAKEPLGIIVVEDASAVGVYEAVAGLEAFEADGAYLMADDISLQEPVPVQIVDGPVYLDALGNARDAIPISLPEDEG